jgi:hypothetical protein
LNAYQNHIQPSLMVKSHFHKPFILHGATGGGWWLDLAKASSEIIAH